MCRLDLRRYPRVALLRALPDLLSMPIETVPVDATAFVYAHVALSPIGFKYARPCSESSSTNVRGQYDSTLAQGVTGMVIVNSPSGHLGTHVRKRLMISLRLPPAAYPPGSPSEGR